MTAAAKDPSAAGDLALIFNFMKMLDPGSVVRESEFATASNAAGVPDRIRNQYNRIVDGKRLTNRQRADFVNRSEKLFNSQEKLIEKIESDFVQLAKDNGLSRDDVITRGRGERVEDDKLLKEFNKILGDPRIDKAALDVLKTIESPSGRVLKFGVR